MKEFVGRIGSLRRRFGAHKIDELVRQSPERAYDVDFFEQFAREVGWRLPT